jgi:hypothetical protein
MVVISMHPLHSFSWPSSGESTGLIRNGLLRPNAPHLATVLCLCLACVLIACHSDRRESSYPSLADAKKDRAIDRGWIPDFLPESSRAIHEVHDISPSTTWCAFEFLPSDSQGLRKSLGSVDASPPSVRRVPNPGKWWWPAVLRGDLDLVKIHGAGFELYVVVTPDTPSTTEVLLFAVDWTKGHGFFYRTRR